MQKIATRIASRSDIIEYLQRVVKQRKSRVLAMYNSDLDMLIDCNEGDLMVFPVDDRLANRAHGVMETGNVKGYKMSGLNVHIDRLFRSAEILGMQIPLSKTDIESIQSQYLAKIHELALLSYSILERENHPNIEDTVMVLKIWVSTGLGDFDIQGCDKVPIVYAALYVNQASTVNYSEGVKEYIHPEMWKSQDYFANAKTVNYLSLATMADYSRLRGGYYGIKTDQDGYLLEGAISNIAFGLKDGTFAHPPLSKTIRGTTLSKAIKLINRPIIEKELKIEDLDQVTEMFHLSNDHVIPILSINDIQMGDGKVGPIARFLQEQLEVARSSVKLDGEFVRGIQKE